MIKKNREHKTYTLEHKSINCSRIKNVCLKIYCFNLTKKIINSIMYKCLPRFFNWLDKFNVQLDDVFFIC